MRAEEGTFDLGTLNRVNNRVIHDEEEDKLDNEDDDDSSKNHQEDTG